MELIQQYFTAFTSNQLQKFAALQPLYTEWNTKINVISRKDIEALYEKHILHSLAIAAVFNFKDDAQILDLGTGGGFPGVPLAIYYPNVQFTLVDSINKKLKVIDAIASELGLTNITTIHTRVEDIKDKAFDYVVTRAVANLSQLWQWSKPLLKKNNTAIKIDNTNNLHSLICLKGGDLAAEIQTSQTKPRVWDLEQLFATPFFNQKYMLQVSK